MEAIQVFLQEKDYYIKNIRHKQWEILKVYVDSYSCIFLHFNVYSYLCVFAVAKSRPIWWEMHVYEDCTMIFV